ncbi:Gx transporter family protein [Anaerobacillus sp. HL2]|nr:Gx transporter family protein [Anaerobacillus sp. HL2]
MVHNTTQIFIASLVIGQIVIFYYLPVLLVAAVITGYITGSVREMVIDGLEERCLTNG